MMKKALIIIASLFAVIIIAFIALIKIYITPDRVREFLIPYAEQTLNRKVLIGEVRISLFKGIEVKDFAIREKDGQADFVRCKEFVLKYQLLPLLSRRIIIDELRLLAPEINITRYDTGVFNFDDLVKKEKVQTAAQEKRLPPVKGLPVDLLVNDIRIEDSKFSFADGMKKFPDTRGSLSVKASVKGPDASGLSSEGNMDLMLDEIVFPSINFNNVTVSLAYAVHLSPGSNEIIIDRADLKIQEIPVSITGRVKNTDKEPAIDLAVAIPRLEMSDLQKELSARPGLKGLSLSGNISADLKVKGASGKIETLKTDGMVLFEKAALTLNGKNAALDGNLKFRDQSVNIHVTGTAGKSTAEIKGSVSNFKYPRIRLNLHSKQLFLDELMPAAAATAAASIPRKGTAPPADKPREARPLKFRLSAEGEVRVDSASYKGVNATGIYARYNFRNNKLDVPKITATVGKGTLNVNGTIDFSRPGYIYYLSAGLDSLHADEIVNPLFPKAGDTVFGNLSASLRLSGAGTSRESIRNNLAGDGDFNVTDGKITNAKLTENLAAFLDIDELKTISLNKASGTIRIRDGIAHIDSIFTSDDISMDPSGYIGLNESLNLAFDLKLSPRLSKKAVGSDIAKYIRDEDGWGMIPLKVSGTLSNPSYGVDIAKAGKRSIIKEVGRFIHKLFNGDSGEKPADEEAK